MNLPRSTFVAEVVISGLAVILVVTIVLFTQKGTSSIDSDTQTNGISSKQSQVSSSEKTEILSDHLSFNEKPDSLFSWTWDAASKNSGSLKATLQPIDGSTAKEITFRLPLFANDYWVSGSNEKVQYNSSTNSIVFRSDNFDSYNHTFGNVYYPFCAALFQTKEGQSEPTLLIETTDDCGSSSLGSWIVHPRVPLLFVATRHKNSSDLYLTVFDLNDSRKRKEFGPVAHDASVEELRISTDGNTVYSFYDDKESNGGFVWSFDITSEKIDNSRFSHPYKNHENFPISLTIDPENFSPNLEWLAYHFELIRLSENKRYSMPGMERYSGWNASIQWSSDDQWLRVVQSEVAGRRYNRMVKYVVAFNPKTEELIEIPLEPAHIVFLPGTHILVSSNGETYDLDTKEIGKFPSFSKEIQWVWPPSNQKISLSLPISEQESPQSSMEPDELAMSALNIDEAKIECAPPEMHDAENWTDSFGLASCLPIEIAFRKSIETIVGAQGKRTVMRFSPKEVDGYKIPSTVSYFIHSTNDFVAQSRDGRPAPFTGIRNYAESIDNCTTVITTKEGTTGNVCYEWSLTPAFELNLRKIVFFPFKDYYIVAQHNSYLGEERDVKKLQAALENGEYPLPTMRDLKLFDMAVKSIEFRK